MTEKNENGSRKREKAEQWAKKRLIFLPETEEYDDGLQALTGSACEGDFDRLKKLDHYSQAKLLEMLFEQTERRMDFGGLLGVEEAYGLLFAGPAGCGKMTTAEHLVGNLKKLGYVRLVRLTGRSLGKPSRKKAMGRMRAFLALATEETPLVLLAEKLSEHAYAGDLYELILEFAENQDPGVFFPILIEEEADIFSAALKRDFPLIYFPLPSLEERKNYIRLHQNVEVADEEGGAPFSYQLVPEGITPEEIAAETEGFSFAQLGQLVEWMKLYLADIVTRDQVSEQYAYERLQDEGYYKIKGHMVRQAIAMLSPAERSAPVPRILQASPVWQMPVPSPDRPAGRPSGQEVNLSLSEVEQKVRLAAQGGPKDIRVLGKRYEGQPYRPDEFGEVDQRLANASDEYDDEE